MIRKGKRIGAMVYLGIKRLPEQSEAECSFFLSFSITMQFPKMFLRGGGRIGQR